MSDSYGKVKFNDGLIRHFEYNGFDDRVLTKLYNTEKEVEDNWRSYSQANCNCGKSEPVIIFTYYGKGFYWPGRACRHCNAVTNGIYPFEEIEDGKIVNGIPEWVKEGGGS